MNPRRFLLPLLLGAIGYIALSLFVPRFNPSLKWSYKLDHSTAIEHAKKTASRFGIDASLWQGTVSAEREGAIDDFLSRYSIDRDEASLLSPVRTWVTLSAPENKQRKLRVNLTGDGRAIGFEYHDDSRTQTSGPIESARQAVLSAFNNLLGDEAQQFSLVSEVDQGKDGFRFTWEKANSKTQEMKLQAIGLVQGQTLREINVKPSFSPRFINEHRAQRNPILFSVFFSFVLISLTATATIAFYFIGWSRREINNRRLVILFLSAFILSLAFKIVGAGPSNFEVGSVIMALGFSLCLALLWTTGYMLARRSSVERALGFDRLIRGKLLLKSISGSVAAGILFGGFLSAVPYLVTATRLFPRMELDHPEPEHFVSYAPAWSILFPPINLEIFALYGFLLPLLWAYIPLPRINRLLLILLGFVWLIDNEPVHHSILGVLLISGLLILTIDQIYWRYDFLTLVVAGFAATLAPAAWTLTIQHSPSLQSSGWRALSALCLLLIFGFVVNWKGREMRAEEEEELKINTALQQAEREKLVAEFSVARRAQQQMLPTSAPKIPGYEIAATCRPAREVGGDLYDFLVLPDERIGIVVADVSGKGVPAALYMTLTKGLLASVTEHESDPRAILHEVNRHLYEVCGRKMFVTLILGVLDPATQTLTYSRAGHNPGIWRRVAMRTAHLLRAPGLGLGLNKGKLFERALQMESIQFGPGDALLFYSDGITEAMNSNGEEFGEERLLAAVARSDGMSAAETQELILSDVGNFLGQTPPQDDITLVVVRVGEG